MALSPGAAGVKMRFSSGLSAAWDNNVESRAGSTKAAAGSTSKRESKDEEERSCKKVGAWKPASKSAVWRRPPRQPSSHWVAVVRAV